VLRPTTGAQTQQLATGAYKLIGVRAQATDDVPIFPV